MQIKKKLIISPKHCEKHDSSVETFVQKACTKDQQEYKKCISSLIKMESASLQDHQPQMLPTEGSAEQVLGPQGEKRAA